ncbi:MAG: glycosyltransferase family 2 protein [Anaerolineales bacterium]|nr:glycosyltransferase family 2 protein [Anaerolineales bacterium]MCS7247949.1 glycosyltransferase family 2 protein [Anaerolineales bacterium]MDW8161760.1 glycosyltransferase family 2 protein [Anaerolineales bacterium]MDW8448233.1 glycosyltransferase family 2 protein [Anaerolineales bacterium]
MHISIVIPVYNEEENLPLLQSALYSVLSKMNDHSWEVILVDDGSTDSSPEKVQQIALSDPEHVTAILLRRNFGQTAAIAAGIDHARGDVIVLMDADLQNDPRDIPLLIEKIEQGYDVVSGWRKNRQDAFLTRTLPSKIANWLISIVTGVHLHDYGCTLKAYRREVLTGFRLYGEMHRFIPAYASSVGARIVEIPVHHHPRLHGKAKYGLGRILKVILDLFTVKFLMSYAQKPIYVFGGAGIALMSLSVLTVTALVIRRLTIGEHLIRSPLLLLSVMLFIMGFQSLLMGLQAEVLNRTYHESQHKPIYTVRIIYRNGREEKG